MGIKILILKLITVISIIFSILKNVRCGSEFNTKCPNNDYYNENSYCICKSEYIKVNMVIVVNMINIGKLVAKVNMIFVDKW